MPDAERGNGVDPTARLAVYVFVAILLAWGFHQAWTVSVRRVAIERDQSEAISRVERRVTNLERVNDTLDAQLDRIERTINLLVQLRGESAKWPTTSQGLPTRK